MEQGMVKIDIEEIMQEIRDNIEKRGYSDEILSFQDASSEITGVDDREPFRMADLNNYVYEANCNCDVPYYAPITESSVKKLIKKVMRKLMSFQIVPMSVQQNAFNVAVARSLASVQKYIMENGGENENHMSKKQEENYFEYQEKLTEQLETKILVLEKRIEELEAQLSEKGK